jgi:hypothetical protein
LTPWIDLWCSTPHEGYAATALEGPVRQRFRRDRRLARAAAGAPAEHPYKYRLAYVVDGKRIVGYDNEQGKGDHRHLGKRELPYRFVSPRQLVTDFMDDVKGTVK